MTKCQDHVLLNITSATKTILKKKIERNEKKNVQLSVCHEGLSERIIMMDKNCYEFSKQIFTSFLHFFLYA